MTFTLTATPDTVSIPPRVLLEAVESDPDLPIQSCSFYRGGVPLRFTANVAGDTAVAYDYDAPFDVVLDYRADAVESGIVEAWAEAWASLASWTAVGTGWAVAAGVASSPADGSSIYRDTGSDLASLAVTSPSNLTVQLLDASALVVASVLVSLDGNVTVTADSVSTVVGSGSFTLSVAETSLSVAGTGWSTSVTLGDSVTRVRLVAPSGVSFVSKFGSAGSGDGQFSSPSGMASDGSGNVFVVDNGNNRIQKFNSAGVYQSQFGSSGSGNGQFNAPRGIAIDGSGNIYVADFINNRVQKFNSAGVYQSQFGSAGAGNGQFSSPHSIAIDGSGNILVTDYNNHRVQKFNSAGVYQSQFGSIGSGNGQFNHPRGIAIDGSGNIYVADFTNHRIQKFNSAGVYQSQFGSSGSGNGQFNVGPKGIAIDGSGNIWVSDSDRIQKFNSSGVYQSQFGSSGSGNGQFNLTDSLRFDASGNLWVVDQGNARIQKFTLAGASVDDITATIFTEEITATASDTANLTGITAAWLTNAAQPELAIQVTADGSSDDHICFSGETLRETTAVSSSVALDIEGSPDTLTVVTGPRRNKVGSAELICLDTAARRTLETLLANSAPIGFRFPASLGYMALDDGFYAVGDLGLSRVQNPWETRDEVTLATLPLTPSRPPAFDVLWQWRYDALAQTGLTYDQVAATFATYTDLLIGPTT